MQELCVKNIVNLSCYILKGTLRGQKSVNVLFEHFHVSENRNDIRILLHRHTDIYQASGSIDRFLEHEIGLYSSRSRYMILHTMSVSHRRWIRVMRTVQAIQRRISFYRAVGSRRVYYLEDSRMPVRKSRETQAKRKGFCLTRSLRCFSTANPFSR